MPAITLESKLPKTTEPSLKNLTKSLQTKSSQEQHQPLQNLTKPHVGSYNWFVNYGVKLIPDGVSPVETMVFDRKLSIVVTEALLDKPTIDDKYRSYRTLQVFPAECRQRGTSYYGKLHLKLSVYVDGMKQGTIVRCVGNVPIMVKSVACNLHNLSREALISHQEDQEEMGGYFIINGNEKVVRMIIMPKRNYPLGIVRQAWKKKLPNFTEFGVTVRSMTEFQTTSSMIVHYLSNGTCIICITIRKQPYYLPLMLVVKALVGFSDVEIYREMICTKQDDTYFKGCIQNMLRQMKKQELVDQESALKFLGSKFRHRLNMAVWCSDNDAAKCLLDNYILIHLKSNEEKLRFLCLLVRKVFDLAMGKCMPDDADSLQNQEVLLPGHLMQMYLVELLNSWGFGLKRVITKKCAAGTATMVSMSLIQTCMTHVPDVSNALIYTLATGNCNSSSGLGLMQFKGLSVLADKLNFMRYVSHFRAVHRGAFFSEMRTTAVRKLLPESWGFLCPVHTPDGSPCGLLNHLTYLCEIVTHSESSSTILTFLHEVGMLLPGSDKIYEQGKFYPVLLNGNLLGWLPLNVAKAAEKQLRCKKALCSGSIPSNLEVSLIEYTGKPTQYPGFYLCTDTARFVRPVMNLTTGTLELISPFEQVYLDICIVPEEAHKLTTHQEITQHSILSAIASLTPFSDHNQSPRNMYQCQMGKQTMGVPSHTINYRGDNKMYQLQTPQSPLVRPHMYDHLNMDDYPLGTNAVVAVISYTGYDMEDAMILNKSSFERGFGHSSIYKTQIIDLEKIVDSSFGTAVFGVDERDEQFPDLQLSNDGLPAIGQKLVKGGDFYSYIQSTTGSMTVVKYKDDETAYVHTVRVLSNDAGTGIFCRVSITVRVPRNPIIGDKFASRHGQKGVCSQMWPVESIPFTESGMIPDILFNPHGFPSRMTIGMMIESMAGKAASVHGHCYDATPFTFTEERPAIAYFGELLNNAGFNYFGTETLYSGISGLELEAEIFIGVVYYQRLRHMVSDKFQVRTTGPVDQLTRQPVKGRKIGGGVRFGEMERDALLSHGCAMLIHDRLLQCSDLVQAYVCEKCGSLLSPLQKHHYGSKHRSKHQVRSSCKICKTPDHLSLVDIPFAYRYLVNELAAMNIKTVMKVS